MLEKGDAASSSAPLYSTLDSDKSYKCWLFMRNSVKNVFHTSVFFRRLSTTCLSVSESTFTLAWNFPCWPQNAEMISFISKLHRTGQPNYTFNQTIRDTFLFYLDIILLHLVIKPLQSSSYPTICTSPAVTRFPVGLVRHTSVGIIAMKSLIIIIFFNAWSNSFY